MITRTTLIPLPTLIAIACGGAPSSIEVADMGTVQVARSTADGSLVVKGPHGACVIPPVDDLAEPADHAGQQPDEEQELDAVLFFQLGMYRLCEMKINQDLTTEHYRELVRRLIASTNRLLKSRIVRAEARKAEAEARKVEAEARKVEAEGGPSEGDAGVAEPSGDRLFLKSPYDAN